MTELKPVAEAQEAIFSMMGQAGTEMCDLQAAAGRVLAEDISANLNHPAANISAMDGYALMSGGEGLEIGCIAQVVGEAAAGHLSATAITSGMAVRIFTGAYLPEGADCVALQEDVIRDGDKIILNEEVEAGQFVRSKGMDFGVGEVILHAGQILGPRHLALASLAGLSVLPVRQQPVIAILSSGDELVEVGAIPKAGQLINSNSVFLAEALAKAGAKIVDLGIIPDKKGALISALEAGYAVHKNFDMAVCTGGASVGNHDHIAGDLTEDSASKIDFWRIAMRPGKPLIAASWQKIPFLGLPGNPVSAGVCALIFVLPALRYFLGLNAQPVIQTLPLDSDLPKNDRRQDYIRAVYSKDQNGNVSVKPLGKQDSSMLRNFCHADALILRPPFAKPAQKGESVPVIEIDTRL
jgi:molybdopterin molybdotransferase